MASCSTNTNPLYNNFFKLTFARGTRQVELMCQRVTLPGISVPDLTQPTTLGTTIPYASTALGFEPLKIEFIVDSDLENWKSLYSWIRNISNLENDTSHNIEYSKWHINGILEILNPISTMGTTLTITFFNIMPVSLGGILFQTDNVDTNIVKCSAAFKYSYYTMSPDAPSNLLEET